MPISVICECGRERLVEYEYAGSRTHCPYCGYVLVLPNSEEIHFEDRKLLAPSAESDPLFGQQGGVPRTDPVETSGKAIASLVLGVASLAWFLLGVPGLILGIVSVRDIHRSFGTLRGRPFAIGGIVLSAIGLILGLVAATSHCGEPMRRSACINNLKQIGLALENYSNLQGRFPGQAILGKDGKPLLSWRVAILPYIEHAELYKHFHLDEPWDSPHNSVLIPLMPAMYICPSRPESNLAQSGTTTYQALTGPHTMFDDPQGTPINTVRGNAIRSALGADGSPTRICLPTDGPSNTILVVESTRPVTWTKPDDINVPDGQPPAGLGSQHNSGFNVLFVDGSVRFLKTRNLRPELLRALTTRDGGETVNPDDY